MGRSAVRAALPWLIAASVVGLHLESRLAPPSPADQSNMEEQGPPPRRAPKAEPETLRVAPPQPV